MVAGMHFSRVISITAYWRYLVNLWPLLLIFALVQLTMRLTGNSASIGLPVWITGVDLMLFLINFGVASMWAQMPAAKCAAGLTAQSRRHHQTMETMMAELPLRALKAFSVSGIIYATYLMGLMTVAASVNEVVLSPRMLLALGISFYFTTVVLAPAVGVANTIDYATRLRRRLASIGVFVGDLASAKKPRILVGSVRRPWMVFTVTGFLPTSLLAMYVYMALGVADAMEQRFIIAQALVLFVASLLAGIYLVYTISNVLKVVTGELAKGLDHLRQGRFDGRVPVLMDDEMGELACGLNTALKGLQEREDLKDTLKIAAEIQQGLQPSQPPQLDDYSIRGFQKSCFAIGGDYYDHILLPNGSYWLVIADVTGKGFPAALTVANLQAMLHALAASHPKLKDAAAYINTALCNTMTGGRFVTIFMAELHPADHHMLWLN
ncbi:MAG: SpoIIE family protein phosphatase, partial [Mariprofundaceae bacterium]